MALMRCSRLLRVARTGPAGEARLLRGLRIKCAAPSARWRRPHSVVPTLIHGRPASTTATYPRHTRIAQKAREDGQVARSRDLAHFAATRRRRGPAGGAGAVGAARRGCSSCWRDGLRFDAARRALSPAPMGERAGSLRRSAAAGGAAARRRDGARWRRGGGAVGRLELDLQAAGAERSASSTRWPASAACSPSSSWATR